MFLRLATEEFANSFGSHAFVRHFASFSAFRTRYGVRTTHGEEQQRQLHQVKTVSEYSAGDCEVCRPPSQQFLVFPGSTYSSRTKYYPLGWEVCVLGGGFCVLVIGDWSLLCEARDMMCQLAGGIGWWRSGGPGTVCVCDCVCVDCWSQFRRLPDGVT
jgi:hypothetical protein